MSETAPATSRNDSDGDDDFVAERPAEHALDVEPARRFERARKRVDDPRRLPAREQRPVARERGRDRKRDGERRQRRDRNDEPELREKLADRAGQERDRQKDDDVDERDYHRRRADFGPAEDCGGLRSFAVVVMAFGILEHDDRIVDQDADEQRHREQRDRIDRKIREAHHEERDEQRRRDRDQHDDRIAPRA